jgi:signal transduction histidine kinase
LDDLKTKFVGNVSHELRTPLVAIQKSLALIADQEVGSVTPEQKKFLDIAQRNIERLSRLINDLLDVQRLEAGQMNLKPSTFPVNGLIQHVISTVETWAKDKGVTVKADFPSHEDVELEADPDRLTQVITNLVGNAIKFTPDKGTITVELRKNVKDETLPGGIGIEVGVRDTGVGIEPEDQKKIFDKFVQVSLSQPSGISSSGLGLTITKEIVELHSGRIWVESEPGKGSRFAFRVPLKFSAHRKVHGS